MKKISETFLDFVQPLMTLAANPKPGKEEFNKVLKTGWLVWNAVVMSDINNDPVIMDSIKETLPEDMYQLIEFLAKRKREEFSNYKYFLGEYELRKKATGYSLFIEARESQEVRVQ